MGNQSGLFGDGDVQKTAGEPSVEGSEARYQRPIRDQVEFDPRSLDMRIPEDHPARMVWETVEKLDFRPFYAEIRAVAGRPGRPPIDPRILFALWVYATLDAVGSARRVAELCEDSTPYQWLCGGVGVNHHALSDFRAQNPEKIKRMMIEHIAVLRVSGLVGLRRVTQDGVKVRAHAGGSSFRRQERLDGFLAEAEAQLAELERQAENDPGAEQTREKAAAERAARDRVKRVNEALAVLEKLQQAKPNPRTAHKDRKDPSQFRASMTDADARMMRMSDGGHRPAYNVQIATDTTAGVVVDVALAETGADQPELVPMLDRLKETYGKEPEEMLVDGGYYTRAGIDHADAVGTKLYMPAPKRKEGKQSTGTEAMQALDGRMETLEAQAIFKLRPQWAEWVNALARNRGLRQVLVRGREKVEAAVRWFAIAHNFAVGMANAC